MSVEQLLASLPEAQRKHLDPSSPGSMRMMAAKGMAPLPPREMVIVLAGLSLDADENLAGAAHATLASLPDKILGPAIDARLPAEALGAVAELLAAVEDEEGKKSNIDVLEKVVLNRETPDEAIALLAPNVPSSVAEIIASNQERCLRSEVVVDAIRKNTKILKSSLDRLFDFLVRAGVFYDGMDEFNEAMARLSPTEMEEAVESVELPTELNSLLEESDASNERAEAMIETLEEVAEKAHERIPILKLINGLNIAQKIALATKGNKEARTILLRASNRLVATATIRNPRITEQEIMAAANSRSVVDDVIRIIARSKEMSRSYAVKKALVQNPKTPVPTAMHLLTLLRANDVRDVAKSRNVSSAVANQAKRLVTRK